VTGRAGLKSQLSLSPGPGVAGSDAWPLGHCHGRRDLGLQVGLVSGLPSVVYVAGLTTRATARATTGDWLAWGRLTLAAWAGLGPAGLG
jgi:hypothetical protein